MQQIYLLEIFVDSVRIFVTGEEERSSESKNLTVKIGFGPKTEIFIREHQLNPDYAENSVENKDLDIKKEVEEDLNEDLVTVDEYGNRGWSRKVRVGKSFLFPSYSDTVLTTLRDFPLEIEVWNDDDREMYVFAANGVMRWDKQFFEWLQDEDQPDELHESFCVKQIVPLKSECCCKILGEISLILRLNALGDSITTEFQATNDEDLFYIRSDKSPNVLQCMRLEPFNDLNFVTIGSIYDTVTLEDPTTLGKDDIEVCTEFDTQPCSKGAKPDDFVCRRQKVDKDATKIQDNKIKMGDIKGPCGNPNCRLAHKVRTFLRKLDSYKEAAAAKNIGDETKDPDLRNVCGSCVCKQEQWHRDGCPEKCVLPNGCDETNKVTFNSKFAPPSQDTNNIKKEIINNPVPTNDNSDTPHKTFKGTDAQGNIVKRVCISRKCQRPECPKVMCSTKKHYETQVNPLLFAAKTEHKDYYTYIDLQNQCKSVICESNCDPKCMGKSSGNEENNKNSKDFSKDYYTYRDLQIQCNSSSCGNLTCDPKCMGSIEHEKIEEKSSPYSQNFIVQNVTVKYDIHSTKPCSGCGCHCQVKNVVKPVREETSNIPSPSTSTEPKFFKSEKSDVDVEIKDRDKKANYIRGEISGEPNVDPSGVPSREIWSDSKREMRNENKIAKQNRDYASPYSQIVYKTLSDPKTLSAAETEALKQQQISCEPKNDKECKCDPQKPTPPCKTFDCQCLTKNIETASRKLHKPYCPNYIHKENCPVNKTDADEENDYEEEEPEPLPYGLPPIQLGPCPVLGRPCSVPDGFARMYKVAAIPPQPPSWSDAGKICCAKEFERIKKAIDEYMKYEKSHDMRCLNKFNIDTERRCCDKEQRLFALMGKGCCGSHKISLQDKYKDYKEKQNHP